MFPSLSIVNLLASSPLNDNTVSTPSGSNALVTPTVVPTAELSGTLLLNMVTVKFGISLTSNTEILMRFLSTLVPSEDSKSTS